MKITEVIEEIGRPVAYYPRLAKVFGIKESILLSQLLYWKGKEYEPKKGIKKTAGEIEKETGLTYKEQIRIKDKLKELNCINIEYDRLNHSSYYLLNETTINEIYQGHIPKGHIPKGKEAPTQREGGTCPKVSSSITENTTEITTEIYTHYKNKINSNAKLLTKAQDKIKARLKVFTYKELRKAINNFSENKWQMEHNDSRGLAWFFHSDDRIENYVNMKSDIKPKSTKYGKSVNKIKN